MTKPLQMTFLAAALAFACLGAQAAPNAEPMDLEPDVLAKLAHERAKARGLSNKSAGVGRPGANADASNPLAECGAVNIGNVLTGGRPGFQPREVTVVITGDVINANNNCR
jgi:hypothetical protein